MSRNLQVFNTWTLIQDLVGDATTWPRIIRRVFWDKDAGHWQRIMLATFAFVNGLTPSVLFEWLSLLNFPQRKIDHMKYLIKRFEDNPRCYRLYSWNTTMRRYEWLDGQPKGKSWIFISHALPQALFSYLLLPYRAIILWNFTRSLLQRILFHSLIDHGSGKIISISRILQPKAMLRWLAVQWEFPGLADKNERCHI